MNERKKKRNHEITHTHTHQNKKNAKQTGAQRTLNEREQEKQDKKR